MRCCVDFVDGFDEFVFGIPQVVGLRFEERVAFPQLGVFFDGGMVDGAHGVQAISQGSDFAENRRPVGVVHRGEIFFGRIAAFPPYFRADFGFGTVVVFEFVEAHFGFKFFVGEPEILFPIERGNVELIFRGNFFRNKRALRRFFGEADFERVELCFVFAQSVALGNERAVERFRISFEFAELGALRVQRGGGLGNRSRELFGAGTRIFRLFAERGDLRKHHFLFAFPCGDA